MEHSRRSFISFLGKASLGSFVIPPFLMSCGNTPTPTTGEKISKVTIDRLKKVLLKSTFKKGSEFSFTLKKVK